MLVPADLIWFQTLSDVVKSVEDAPRVCDMKGPLKSMFLMSAAMLLVTVPPSVLLDQAAIAAESQAAIAAKSPSAQDSVDYQKLLQHMIDLRRRQRWNEIIAESRSFPHSQHDFKIFVLPCLFEAYYNTGRYSEAHKTLDALSPASNKMYWYYKGLYALATNDNRTARQCFEKVPQPDRPDPKFESTSSLDLHKLEALIGCGDEQAITRLLSRWHELPATSTTWFVSNGRDGDRKNALEAFSRLFAKNLEVGRVGALWLASKVPASMLDDNSLRKCFALWEIRDKPAGLSASKNLFSQVTGNPEKCLIAANFLIRIKNPALAISYLNSKAADLDKIASYWLLRGNCNSQHNPAEAERCFNNVIRLDPNSAEAYFKRYSVRKQIHQSQSGALHDLNNAIRLNPSHSAYREERMLSHEHAGKTDKAIQDCIELIVQNTGTAKATYLLKKAELEIMKGDRTAYLDTLKFAASVDTNDPEIKSRISRMLSKAP
jgi:tetratricopeptide (TPR) repeat protein